MRCRVFLSIFLLLSSCSSASPAPETTPDAPNVPAGDEPQPAPPPPPDPKGWAPAGDLAVARALTTATLLADGRVLVVGGEDSDYGMLASVEIFDPKTGAFTKGPDLPSPRVHHTATRLKSGEVLVAGGGQGSEISLPTGEKTLASALLFDPKTNQWRETASMNAARAGHRAALLADGRVLVAGGGDKIGYPCAAIHPNCNVAAALGSAEIYDPAAGTWTATGSLLQSRLAFSMDVTSAGVVAAGGGADNQGLDSVEIFDASAGVWRAGPKLDGQRLYQSTVVLGDELVVAGGKIANVAPITTVDTLDESGTRWTHRASLDEPRTGASFVALPSGKGLLVAGDDQTGQQFLDEAALYDRAANTWTKIHPIANPRYSQVAVVLGDGSVLVVGGRDADGAMNKTERSR
jgi:N-acetylneuraminic acid mutarotase